jgi:TrmH family RNA methyltransferase
VITSKQNSKLKLVRELSGRARDRRAAGAFVAEGARLVEEAARVGWPFQFALYADGLSVRAEQLVESLRGAGIAVEQVSADLMQWMADTETSQGLIAVLEEERLPIPERLDFVLIADQIRDPGNLGALLRTADAAGVQAVLIPPETADPFAPKVVRAGMGAHFRLPILARAWDEIETQTKGLQVLLAEMGAKSCWDTDLVQPLALIVGGEASGASARAKALRSGSIGVPMNGGTESLNAAIAGSVLMFEIVRQRRGAGR